MFEFGHALFDFVNFGAGVGNLFAQGFHVRIHPFARHSSSSLRDRFDPLLMQFGVVDSEYIGDRRQPFKFGKSSRVYPSTHRLVGDSTDSFAEFFVAVARSEKMFLDGAGERLLRVHFPPFVYHIDYGGRCVGFEFSTMYARTGVLC